MGMLEMIASFNCLTGMRQHDGMRQNSRDYHLSADAVAAALYTETDDSQSVQNAMAWYVGEEVCRAYVDMCEVANV